MSCLPLRMQVSRSYALCVRLMSMIASSSSACHTGKRRCCTSHLLTGHCYSHLLHVNNNNCSSNSSTEPQKELTPAQIRAHLRTRPDSLDNANPHDQLLRVDVLAFCLSDAVPIETEAASADSSTGSSNGAATAGDVPAFIRNR
jgi:hypothetical protein